MANALTNKSKPYDRPSQAFQQPSGGKKCRYGRRNGHLIEECLKKRWKDTQANDKDEVQDASQPYWKDKEKSAL